MSSGSTGASEIAIAPFSRLYAPTESDFSPTCNSAITSPRRSRSPTRFFHDQAYGQIRLIYASLASQPRRELAAHCRRQTLRSSRASRPYPRAARCAPARAGAERCPPSRADRRPVPRSFQRICAVPRRSESSPPNAERPLPPCSRRSCRIFTPSVTMGFQIALRAASKHVDGLLYLQRVAHVVAQRLVHVGDQRGEPLAAEVADAHHRLR